jgi:hypothetical protein
MDEYKIFTLKPYWFPLKKVRELVDHLHDNDQHYVLMVDPGKPFPPQFLSPETDWCRSGCVSGIFPTQQFELLSLELTAHAEL